MTARMWRALLIASTLALGLPGGVAQAQGVQLNAIGSFAQPVQATGAPADGERVFVVEKGGTIRVVHGGSSSLFLNVAAAVGGISSGGEQGLLSMAFPPDYQSSRRFYVYFTDFDADGDGQANRVVEFQRSATNPDVADPASARTVISIPHPTASNHNGGQLQFGPDGYLYVAPGDGGNTPGLAQDLGSLSGKMLRIDPRQSGTNAYSVPGSNPFVGQTGARPEIYHLGLRNPFRFSFDRSTGDLVIGDVGGGLQEEVTLLPSGTPAGRNLGWPTCEGTSCAGPAPSNYVAPALAYAQGSPRAVTGGYVVRDPVLGGLFGRYIYADFYEGVIRSASLAAGAGQGHGAPVGVPRVPNLASFGEDAGGCIYVASLSGPVYRLAAEGQQTVAPCAAQGTPVPNDPPPPPAIASGAAPGAGAHPDTRAPLLRLGRARAGTKSVVVTASCDESCRLAAGGSVSVPGTSRVFRLRGTRRSAAAGRRVTLRLKLTRSARGAARNALRRDRRVSVRVTITATDAAGNRRSARRRLSVR